MAEIAAAPVAAADAQPAMESDAQGGKTYEKRTISLKHIPERRAFFAGIAKAYDTLVVKREADLTQLAETCRWQTKSFYSRLLSGQVEFKALPGSDVSAAEWDLRNLNVQQLLFIRNQTLELETEGKSNFSRHHSFIKKVEKYLFEMLGRILLSVEATESDDKAALYSFGVSVTIVLGAIEKMVELDGECDLPPMWLFVLDEDHWVSRAALVHIDELWAEDIPWEMEELRDWMPDRENSVAAVCDRAGVLSAPSARISLGSQEKQLRWQINILNVFEDDAFTEMAEQAEKNIKARKSMVHIDAELKGQMSRRSIEVQGEALGSAELVAAECLNGVETPRDRQAPVFNKTPTSPTRRTTRLADNCRPSSRLSLATGSHASLSTSYVELCGEPDTPRENMDSESAFERTLKQVEGWKDADKDRIPILMAACHLNSFTSAQVLEFIDLEYPMDTVDVLKAFTSARNGKGCISDPENKEAIIKHFAESRSLDSYTDKVAASLGSLEQAANVILPPHILPQTGIRTEDEMSTLVEKIEAQSHQGRNDGNDKKLDVIKEEIHTHIKQFTGLQVVQLMNLFGRHACYDEYKADVVAILKQRMTGVTCEEVVVAIRGVDKGKFQMEIIKSMKANITDGQHKSAIVAANRFEKKEIEKLLRDVGAVIPKATSKASFAPVVLPFQNPPESLGIDQGTPREPMREADGLCSRCSQTCTVS